MNLHGTFPVALLVKRSHILIEPCFLLCQNEPYFFRRHCGKESAKKRVLCTLVIKKRLLKTIDMHSPPVSFALNSLFSCQKQLQRLSFKILEDTNYTAVTMRQTTVIEKFVRQMQLSHTSVWSNSELRQLRQILYV